MSLPPVVSFVGPSGTGKTTLLEALLPELRRRGLRVACVKHDAHRVQIDREGKDSFRLRRAGASPVVLASREEFAVMGDLDGELPLLEAVARFAGDVDLVVTEGYRRTALPKVRVHRAARGAEPGWTAGDGVFAAATDVPLGLGVPEVGLDDAAALADVVLAHLGLAGAGASVPLTGVVFAGGASSRMGRDKAWLEWDGRPVLRQLVHQLEIVTGTEPMVVAREGQALPEAGARVVYDLRPHEGPLGGLLTALAAVPRPAALVVACDMPRVRTDLLRLLASSIRRGDDAVVPVREGRREPLLAAYAVSCLPAVHRALLAGERRMDGFLGAVRTRDLPEAAWRAADPGGDSFRDVDTPDDLAG